MKATERFSRRLGQTGPLSIQPQGSQHFNDTAIPTQDTNTTRLQQLEPIQGKSVDINPSSTKPKSQFTMPNPATRQSDIPNGPNAQKISVTPKNKTTHSPKKLALQANKPRDINERTSRRRRRRRRSSSSLVHGARPARNDGNGKTAPATSRPRRRRIPDRFPMQLPKKKERGWRDWEFRGEEMLIGS